MGDNPNVLAGLTKINLSFKQRNLLTSSTTSHYYEYVQ
jgi:hypothetical protein